MDIYLYVVNKKMKKIFQAKGVNMKKSNKQRAKRLAKARGQAKVILHEKIMKRPYK